MNNRKDFFVLLILLCVILCCKKEKSFELGPPTDGLLAATGKAILTVDNPCSEGAVVEISAFSLSGQLIKKITPQISSVLPDCDDPSFIKTELPIGKLKLVAVCSGDSSAQEVEIFQDSCQSFHWHYDLANPPALAGDWFPLHTRWTYSDLTGGDTLAISSSATEVMGNQEYAVFTNDATIERRSYRKDGSKYYEMVTYFRDAPLLLPVELLFLQDDLPVGTSWEAASATPLIRGFAVQAKVINTIVNRGHSQSFNGKTYYNLIEVKNELLIRSEDGEYHLFGKAATTIYAKGVGVVFYEDEVYKKSREILNYSVVP